MPLEPGTKLGPYEIVGPLGAGGMGEVYRARDTRLDREVAVKVLPASLADNPQVRARFEREAKTVSSLNHPHICVLHDVGRDGEVCFLVMELVEGETLAQRLDKGPLPPPDVLKIGAQIADALDRAHQAGVVHRDLKPANVMLTRSGAKLMDFGLARASGLGGPAGDGSGPTAAPLSQSPTVAQPLTAEGTIIGTFQYMAPEQLEGREADARADLWALGCLLYEMTTGKRAFEGRSQASLVGAIMHAQPRPVATLAPMSPPALDRLVTACLAKDPAERVQSAHDVRLQLEWMVEGATSVSALPAGSGPRRWIVPVGVAVAASVVTALVTVMTVQGDKTTVAEAAPERYVLGTANLQIQSAPMLSPDGSYAVISVNEDLSRRLYRRNLSSLEMTPIAGTEDGRGPFFSPDGAWIGFATSDSLKKVPSGGGVAQLIVSEPAINAADWGEDGMIYFTPRAGGQDGHTALARVPATGGATEIVATLDTDAGEYEAWLPEILPDGKTVLITIAARAGADWRVAAVRPDGSRHSVVENGMLSRYSSGYLLYYEWRSAAVLAAPFDLGTARVTGPAIPLTEEVDPSFCYDVSDDGKLLYVAIPGAGEGNEVVWIDREGAITPALQAPAAWGQPRLSPDGTRVLLRKVGANCELWMLDVERGSLARLVHGNDNHDPIWSPDGRRIVYLQNNLPVKMVALTVEGARKVETIAEGADAGAPQSWSAVGGLLAYTKEGRGTRSDIWVRAMDGDSPPVAFLATEFNEDDPTISPDGKWIAYMSDETGRPEVFVRAYPDTGATWQISIDGGVSPLWSRDGGELYFVSGNRMMAVSIETRPNLRIGAPASLFVGGFSTTRSRDFDVAADGRFLALGRAAGDAGQEEMRILLNWQQDLRRMSGATD